ncbi:DcuS/MalK family sensor histidine kinase [Alkalihalobacillus sp. MEB130]|uniref:DcuS/MalK family sensor histidine kinase n=1 Tax=Alkalihalobacillus sp. MEB130 TaxID=2976704 RepID=UPI0028DF776B|nr:DcuS/MalK family sensor histidine kinase [Alkalihalobacillus sp. MEB130]MDT8860856.1 DcuS/MalK family sensor histidine kinase [Alkalihalobacillus sp. MEB130]
MKKVPLRTKIIFLTCTVVIVALLVNNFLTSKSIEKATIQNIEEKASTISKMVALSPVVIQTLSNNEDTTYLQEYVEELREATNVLFIVILNMDRIRITHPLSEMIGEKFVGGDEEIVFEGVESLSIAEGTLGYSLRYFTPIFDDNGVQIGAAVAGFLLEDVETAIYENRIILFIGTFLSLLIGVLGAVFLSNKIKNILFGMEPPQVAKLLEERSAMLHYAREGIVAVDVNQNITLINGEGKRLFNKVAKGNQEYIGMNLSHIIPFSEMEHVLTNGISTLDQEISLPNIALVVNQVPLYVDNHIVGAVATFRDKTELKKLAEELTGFKLYTEALRAQTHEFMNKMHVILGMVQLKRYNELVVYVKKATNILQDEIRFITKHVKDPVLAGFLLGKVSYARERGAELVFKEEFIIPLPQNRDVSHDLITILGNLIDNGLDAVQSCTRKQLKVSSFYEDHYLYISVQDTGVGMDEQLLNVIFDKETSTKGEKRGFGLYLVHQSVRQLDGNIDVISEEGLGTTFIVEIPYTIQE